MFQQRVIIAKLIYTLLLLATTTTSSQQQEALLLRGTTLSQFPYSILLSPSTAETPSFLYVGCSTAIYEIDPASLQITRTLTGHTNGIRQLAWVRTLNGGVLVSAGHDGTLRRWDVARDYVATTASLILTGHLSDVHTLTVMNDVEGGQVSVVSGGKDTHVIEWNLVTGASVFTYLGHTGEVYACSGVGFSDGVGGMVFTGSTDMTIRQWDTRVATRGLVQIIFGHTSTVATCRVRETLGPGSGYTILSGSNDQTIRQTFVPATSPTYTHIRTYTGHHSPVWPLALSPPNEVASLVGINTAAGEFMFASASWSGNVRVWKLGQAVPVMMLNVSVGFSVSDMVWIGLNQVPGMNYAGLWSVGFARGLKLWDMSSLYSAAVPMTTTMAARTTLSSRLPEPRTTPVSSQEDGADSSSAGILASLDINALATVFMIAIPAGLGAAGLVACIVIRRGSKRHSSPGKLSDEGKSKNKLINGKASATNDATLGRSMELSNAHFPLHQLPSYHQLPFQQQPGAQGYLSHSSSQSHMASALSSMVPTQPVSLNGPFSAPVLPYSGSQPSVLLMQQQHGQNPQLTHVSSGSTGATSSVPLAPYVPSTFQNEATVQESAVYMKNKAGPTLYADERLG